VSWKGSLNRTLTRATGLELRRASKPAPPSARKRRARRKRRPGDRLIEAPVFLLSSVRSGSTLARVLLNSHSKIYAPPELHLRDVEVRLRETKHGEKSFAEHGLDARALEYLLWDRVLDRELQHSGKEILVKKTPQDLFVLDRILECWPDARFMFLLRHPAAIARSRQKARPQDSPERNTEMVLRYVNALTEARERLDGLDVRYEELTTDPRRVTGEICSFLGVPWEEQMLDYGRYDHGRFKAGLGDWSENIKSGRVQPAAPPPPLEEIPEPLRPACVAWGYLPREAAAVAHDASA
jgi:hypothetical protein